MWTQVSFAYSFLVFGVVFGVYCFVLPESSTESMMNRSTEELHTLVLNDSHNEDFNAGLQSLAKPLLISRVPDTDGNTEVRELIKTHFQNLNWIVDEDEFEDSTPYRKRQLFSNIIATYEPKVKNKLVLSCHYDSKKMEAFIGATDSAIPCTILLDVASKLDCSLRRNRQNRKLPLSEDEVTLQMIFFDGKEAFMELSDADSLYGSRHLAAKLAVELNDVEVIDRNGTKAIDDISLFVLLDLIGTSDVAFPTFKSNTQLYFTWLSDIENNLRETGLLNAEGYRAKLPDKPDKILFQNVQFNEIEDDHTPFIRRRPDLQVLHLISYPFPSVWHTEKDNEEAIDWDVTDNFSRIFRVFVANYLHLPAVLQNC